MDNESIRQMRISIQSMQDETAEFRDKFAALSDDDLRELARSQREIAEDAEWQADAAETEIKLREIKAIFGANGRPSPSQRQD